MMGNFIKASLILIVFFSCLLILTPLEAQIEKNKLIQEEKLKKADQLLEEGTQLQKATDYDGALIKSKNSAIVPSHPYAALRHRAQVALPQSAVDQPILNKAMI